MTTPTPGSPTAPDGSGLDVKLRVRCGGLYAMGPGKAALLERVDACRSIAGAGRALGFSYWKTRHMIDEMNACFRSPVVETSKGGRSRGGAELTPMGRQALDLYRSLEAQARQAAAADFAAYGALLKDAPDPLTDPA